MDAGVAAVLGATVGVVGTLGTAVLTYAAARRQAQDVGAVEHGHWLRERRHERYLAFLDGLDAWDRAFDLIWEPLREYRSDPVAGRGRLLAALETLRDRSNDLIRLHERVSLVGPVGVANASASAWRSHRVFFDLVHHAVVGEQPYPEEEADKVLEHSRAAASAFREASRKVMETPPAPTP
ncbi:hypothetical protein [Streptomyces sp. NPDC004592]